MEKREKNLWQAMMNRKVANFQWIEGCRSKHQISSRRWNVLFAKEKSSRAMLEIGKHSIARKSVSGRIFS